MSLTSQLYLSWCSVHFKHHRREQQFTRGPSKGLSCEFNKRNLFLFFFAIILSQTLACVHLDLRLCGAQRLLHRPWSSSQRLQIVMRTINREGGGCGFYRWSVELMSRLWIASYYGEKSWQECNITRNMACNNRNLNAIREHAWLAWLHTIRVCRSFYHRAVLVLSYWSCRRQVC